MPPPSEPPAGPTGYGTSQQYTSASGAFNATAFVIQALLGAAAIATLVRVQACTNSGGLSPTGTVDVLPLVNQIDGNGNAVPHGIVYGLPYCRIQGGANAVICDPQPGDIGIAVFADRDISSVVATRAQANPGSARRNSMSDGMLVAFWCAAIPTSYVQFDGAGNINITSPGTVTIAASAIHLDGPVTSSQTIVAQGDVTGAGISLDHHTHGGVSSGSVQTGPPTP